MKKNATIEISHREQYDAEREIQIIRIDNNMGTHYTLLLFNPKTEKYNYSDVVFDKLSDAWKAFNIAFKGKREGK